LFTFWENPCKNNYIGILASGVLPESKYNGGYKASMKVATEIINIEYGNAFDGENMALWQTRQGHF